MLSVLSSAVSDILSLVLTCLTPAASTTLTLLTPCEFHPIHLCCSSEEKVVQVQVKVKEQGEVSDKWKEVSESKLEGLEAKWE